MDCSSILVKNIKKGTLAIVDKILLTGLKLGTM
jgi:hypothetical protein